MNPAAFLRKPVVLLIVAVLIIVAFFGYAKTGGLFDDFNTDGHIMEYDLGSIFGVVSFRVNFNKVDYANAWQPNGHSETMAITGSYKATYSGTWDQDTYVKYAMVVSGSSSIAEQSPWYQIPKTMVGGGIWSYVTPWNCEVIAIGTLQMKTYMVLGDGIGEITYDQLDDYDYPWDGAYLRSGEPQIYLPANQPGPFEEGDSVSIYVKTGYDTDNSWSIKVYPPADRTDLTQTGTVIKTLGNDVSTYISWTVPAGAFSTSSTNEWIAEIWNTYFNSGYTIILAIDQIEYAPVIVSVTEVSADTFMQYDVRTAQTFAAVSKIKVYAYYGESTSMPPATSTQEWILNGVDYAVSNNNVSFTVMPRTDINGQVIVRITAYDIENRPSSPYTVSFEDDDEEVNPTDPPLEQPFVWTNMAVILSMLVALVAVAIAWFYPGDWKLKIMIMAVILAVGALLIWLAGTLRLG